MDSFFLFVATSVSYCFSLIKTFIQGRFLFVLELPSSLLKDGVNRTSSNQLFSVKPWLEEI